MTNDLKLILDALQFSAERHSRQRRKDVDASPYINHLIAVANVMVKEGGVSNPTILVAAILHDTLEDTETTASQLEERFGPEVRNLVEQVTDDKSLPKEERKRRQVAHAPSLSERAKIVKIADKICNVRDIMENPPKGWSRERRIEYLDWAGRVVQGCRGVNRDLEVFFDEMLARARSSLEKRPD
jgi:guanosine-3',5'-bis(diphosphate) 3'-pyrophosphohydrolase